MVEKLKEQMLDQEEVDDLFYVFSSVWLNGPQYAATTTVAFKSSV